MTTFATNLRSTPTMVGYRGTKDRDRERARETRDF